MAFEDVGVGFANVFSSVCIICVNKLLMGTMGYNFRFAVTLSGLHYLVSAVLMQIYKATGYMTVTKPLPMKEKVSFCFVSSASIIGLNVSLMVNEVGFYQIAKLVIIPFVCLLEFILYKRKFSPGILRSITVVIIGVAIVTVSSIHATVMGILIAVVSIVAAGSQQVLCGHLQRTLSMPSNELLLYTAWPMGFSLLLSGPLLDKFFTGGAWVLDYEYSSGMIMTMLATCLLAVAVNVSQFACLGRFSAVAYQIMSHTKTILVILGGAVLLGDHISLRTSVGMSIAVLGMIGYGYVSQQEKTAAAAEEEVGASKTEQEPLKSTETPVQEKVGKETDDSGNGEDAVEIVDEQ